MGRIAKAQQLAAVLVGAEENPVEATEWIREWERENTLDDLINTLVVVIAPSQEPEVDGNVTLMAISLMKRILKMNARSSSMATRVSCAVALFETFVFPLSDTYRLPSLICLYDNDTMSQMLISCFKASVQSAFPANVPIISNWVSQVLENRDGASQPESEKARQINLMIVFELTGKMAASARFGPNKSAVMSDYGPRWIECIYSRLMVDGSDRLQCHNHGELTVLARILNVLMKLVPNVFSLNYHEQLSQILVQSIEKRECPLIGCGTTCYVGLVLSWEILTSLQTNFVSYTSRMHRRKQQLNEEAIAAEQIRVDDRVALLIAASIRIINETSDSLKHVTTESQLHERSLFMLSIANNAAELLSKFCLESVTYDCLDKKAGQKVVGGVMHRLAAFSSHSEALQEWIVCSGNLYHRGAALSESLSDDCDSSVYLRIGEVLSYGVLLPLLKEEESGIVLMEYIKGQLSEAQTLDSLKLIISILLLFVVGRQSEWEDLKELDGRDDIIEGNFIWPGEDVTGALRNVQFSEFVPTDILEPCHRLDIWSEDLSIEGGTTPYQNLVMEATLSLITSIVTLLSDNQTTMSPLTSIHLLDDGILLLSSMGMKQWAVIRTQNVCLSIEQHVVQCTEIFEALLGSCFCQILARTPTSDDDYDEMTGMISSLLSNACDLVELWNDEYLGYVWWYACKGVPQAFVLKQVLWRLIMNNDRSDLLNIENISLLLNLSDVLNSQNNLESDEPLPPVAMGLAWTSVGEGLRKIMQIVDQSLLQSQSNPDSLIQWLPMLGRYVFVVSKFITDDVLPQLRDTPNPSGDHTLAIRATFEDDIIPLLQDVVLYLENLRTSAYAIFDDNHGSVGRMSYLINEIITWQSLFVLIVTHSSRRDPGIIDQMLQLLVNGYFREYVTLPNTPQGKFAMELTTGKGTMQHDEEAELEGSTPNKTIWAAFVEVISHGVMLSNFNPQWCWRARKFGAWLVSVDSCRMDIPSSPETLNIGLQLWILGALNGGVVMNQLMQENHGGYAALISGTTAALRTSPKFGEPDKCSEVLEEFSVWDSMALDQSDPIYMEDILLFHAMIDDPERSWYPMMMDLDRQLRGSFDMNGLPMENITVCPNLAVNYMNRIVAAFVKFQARKILRRDNINRQEDETMVLIIIQSYLNYLHKAGYFNSISESSILLLIQAILVWRAAITAECSEDMVRGLGLQERARRGAFVQLKLPQASQDNDSDTIDLSVLCNVLRTTMRETKIKLFSQVNCISIDAHLMAISEATRNSESMFSKSPDFSKTLTTILNTY